MAMASVQCHLLIANLGERVWLATTSLAAKANPTQIARLPVAFIPPEPEMRRSRCKEDANDWAGELLKLPMSSLLLLLLLLMMLMLMLMLVLLRCRMRVSLLMLMLMLMLLLLRESTSAPG